MFFIFYITLKHLKPAFICTIFPSLTGETVNKIAKHPACGQWTLLGLPAKGRAMWRPHWRLGPTCRASCPGLAGGLGRGPRPQNYLKDTKPSRGLCKPVVLLEAKEEGQEREKGKEERREGRRGEGRPMAEAVQGGAKSLLFTRSLAWESEQVLSQLRCQLAVWPCKIV